jgi:hypothetical protein
VTVHPGRLAAAALREIDAVIAVGASPEATLKNFAERAGIAFPGMRAAENEEGKAVVWLPGAANGPVPITVVTARAERLRHLRKYAEGNMRYHSFYFRGPGGRQNLKAQNLAVFSQIAEGVDDETWMYHLRRGDYSRWMRECVKDPHLADETQGIEQRNDLDPAQSRGLIREVIEQRYTLPE